MRYLFTTLLMVFILSANAQKTNSLTSVMDCVLTGGILFPANEKDKSVYPLQRDKTTTGFLAQGGIEFPIHAKSHHVFASFGGGIGLMDFRSSDAAGNISDGSSPHGYFAMGINYVNHPMSASRLRLALQIGGGFRADGANSFGSSPYYYYQAKAIRYLTKRIGVGINVTLYNELNTAYTYRAYSTNLSGGIPFNIWSVSADIRYSFPWNN